jgi:DNA-binding Xre family transcriptional regulator
MTIAVKLDLLHNRRMTPTELADRVGMTERSASR